MNIVAFFVYLFVDMKIMYCKKTNCFGHKLNTVHNSYLFIFIFLLNLSRSVFSLTCWSLIIIESPTLELNYKNVKNVFTFLVSPSVLLYFWYSKKMFWKSYKDECRYDEPLLLIINIIAGSMKKKTKNIETIIIFIVCFLRKHIEYVRWFQTYHLCRYRFSRNGIRDMTLYPFHPCK